MVYTNSNILKMIYTNNNILKILQLKTIEKSRKQIYNTWQRINV